VELPRLAGIHITQPDKIHLHETEDPEWPLALGLLQAMELSFTHFDELSENLLRETESLLGEASSDSSKSFARGTFDGLTVLREVCDGVKLLALRSRQVNALYNSQKPLSSAAASVSTETYIATGREAIAKAEVVVKRRELAYQVPWQRIASWRENPTVYRYGYLWSVHSLYYWWRDQGLAEKPGPRPCFLNRMDASEVAVGWGKYSLELARNILDRYLPFSSTFAVNFMNCFVPPPREYKFPAALDMDVEMDEEW